MLSPLQERIRLTLAAVADEVDLALAGGGGLVLSGVVDRRTRDLDFFVRYPSPQPEVVDRVQAALEADGLRVAREEGRDHFARLRVTSADDSTTIDVGTDYRLEPPVRIKGSNVLALADLAADKVLTLWARALPRDFVDFASLTERFSVGELCALAARKDGGFVAIYGLDG
ncbi:MAG: nucleotidyl transferase AbiEii/AbiGii toxin family protein [bacterium]|nr:nucleotidyl transferase AbiEii/AbiGii toxin family protein [bacterium]